MEVERWLDAVQEVLSRDSTGLGDKENLQEELNQCKVRGQYNTVRDLVLFFWPKFWTGF